MLRIQFTSEDLARTRVADTPDVMWEIVSSLHRLQTRHGAAFAGWLKEMRPALRERTLSLTVRHLLLPPVPRAAYFPDFLTPAEGLLGLEAGIDAVMATPRQRFHHELDLLQRSQGQSVWARGLACGEAEIRETLGRALRAYHRRAIAPYWTLVDECVVADRADRAKALRSGGIPALPESFRPTMRWRPPILEVDHPADRHIHLRGRGLLTLHTVTPLGHALLTGTPPLERAREYADIIHDQPGSPQRAHRLNAELRGGRRP